MIFPKSPPSGIDIKIDLFNLRLHTALLEAWGLSDDQYNCYGRCHRNFRDQGYIPEVYVGGGEYQEVALNDQLAASSFFGMNDTQVSNGLNIANLHLVFFVNLATIKGNLEHRGDEETRLDVLKIVEAGPFGFKLLSTELGLSTVMREYDGFLKAANSGMADMHPYHCFRINFQVQYNPITVTP